jgi:hypothetical protein
MQVFSTIALKFKWLISIVRPTAVCLWNRFEWFFFDPKAFCFKGVMTFSLQLLTVLGVGISLQILTSPASIVVENREPIGCFDTAIFKESYALRNLEYPKQIQQSVQDVAIRDWRNVSYVFQVGAISRGLPQNPAAINHHVLCWYVNPRSASRLAEVQRMKADMRRDIEKSAFKEPFQASWIEHAKRMAYAENKPVDMRRRGDFSPDYFLISLADYSTPSSPLDLSKALKPYDSRSRYESTEAWKEDIRIAEINGPEDILNAIETSGLQGRDLAIAFEQFNQSRFFLNWVEVSTASSHAVASKAVIAIYRRGQSEVLGGSLQFKQQQRYFTGTPEKLLPRERLWALLKTNLPIQAADIEIATDPTAFFDPRVMWKVVPILGLVALAWIVANVSARLRKRHRVP